MAEKWMQKAVKHPGGLHKALHVPEGEKIPEGKLEQARHGKDTKTRKMANLAKTFKKYAKKGGKHSHKSRKGGRG